MGDHVAFEFGFSLFLIHDCSISERLSVISTYHTSNYVRVARMNQQPPQCTNQWKHAMTLELWMSPN